MESTLQKILEALRIAPSKEKSFERENLGDIVTGKKDLGLEKSPKGKAKSTLKKVAKSGRDERRTRKYGVPGRFYPRSHSLEAQLAEKCNMNETMERLNIRRNSSLDSETERLCMRSEDEDRLFRAHEIACGFSDDKQEETANGVYRELRNKIEVPKEMLGEYFRDKSVHGSETELADYEWLQFNTLLKTSGEESEAFNRAGSTQIAQETSHSKTDQSACSIRSKEDFQRMKFTTRNTGGDESMTEDYEDIADYERWINTSAFQMKEEGHRELAVSPFGHHPEELFREKDNEQVTGEMREAKEYPKMKFNKNPGVEKDSHAKVRATKRSTKRLCRQERMDTGDEETMPFECLSTSTNESFKSFMSPAVNYIHESTMTPLTGLEITVSTPLDAIDGGDQLNEPGARLPYSNNNLGFPEMHMAWEENRLIEDQVDYTSYSMGNEFHLMSDGSSKRSMKLRRDSPFAFPLIEEFARNGNRLQGSSSPRPRRSSFRNTFSGNVGCFLQSQKIGTMTFGDKLMSTSK